MYSLSKYILNKVMEAFIWFFLNFNFFFHHAERRFHEGHVYKRWNVDIHRLGLLYKQKSSGWKLVACNSVWVLGTGRSNWTGPSNAVVRHLGFRIKQNWVEQLYHLPAMWLWTTYLIYLPFSHLWKEDQMVFKRLLGLYEIKQLKHLL